MHTKIIGHKVSFTKRDIFIVLACISFLLLNIAAVGSNGRERAKRMVCLANLNNLTRAWILYAADNDGKLVNGEAGENMYNRHSNETPWVGRDWFDNYSYTQAPQQQQKAGIKSGALWPYCGSFKLYHCPSGRPGELRNYSIVDSMNGYPRSGTFVGNAGTRVGQTVLWIKKMPEIRVPEPSKRAVFIDEGWITADSYAVHYQTAAWWDNPPVRHSDGATLSFADAHSEHWRWQGKETINSGWNLNTVYMPGTSPFSMEAMVDLRKMQIAVWGRLGY
jgi:prepilin-type processing-associated H-X9-DG protein